MPLTLLFQVSYWWLLGHAAKHLLGRSWWVVGAVAVAVTLATAAGQWRKQSRVADALAGRTSADPSVAEEVDALARRVDDTGRWQTWGVVPVLAGVAALGLAAAFRRREWIVLVPLCLLAAESAASLVVLRRRREQVERWLERRPPPPGWRSVPP